MKKININSKYKEIAFLIVIVGIALFASYQIISNWSSVFAGLNEMITRFLNIISPIIYAFILAYLLFRPIRFIQKNLEKGYEKLFKRNVTSKSSGAFRTLSILIIFGAIITTIAVILNFIIPPVVESAKVLLDNIPQYENQISEWFTFLTEQLSKHNIAIENTGEVTQKISTIMSLLGEKIIDIITYGLSGISTFVIDGVLTIFLTFYFLKDKEMLFSVFNRVREVVLPKKASQKLKVFMQDLDEVVGKFLMGEILDALIVGVVSTTLMIIIGHPFAVLIGVVAGVCNIVPYVGPVIGAILALILGLFNSFTLGAIGFMLLIGYQVIDGNFVQPKIVGEQIGLPPVWIVIAILIGGSYFGAIGMILSVPLAALITVYFKRYEERRKELIVE